MLEIFGTIFGQSELDCGLPSGGSKLSSYVCLGSSEMNCRIVDRPMCAIFVLMLKMNNMLIVYKLC